MKKGTTGTPRVAYAAPRRGEAGHRPGFGYSFLENLAALASMYESNIWASTGS